MAKCLVTGHRGYIGSHIYAKLEALGHEVKGIDLKEGRNIDWFYEEKTKEEEQVREQKG